MQTAGNNLVGDVLDGNLARDIYVFDRQNGSFDLVTRDAARPRPRGFRAAKQHGQHRDHRRPDLG